MMPNAVIELMLRGLILCLLTAVTLKLCQRTAAAYRHLICVVSLLGLLALPFAQQLMPPLRLLPARRAASSELQTATTADLGRLSGVRPNSETTSTPLYPLKQPAGNDLSPWTQEGSRSLATDGYDGRSPSRLDRTGLATAVLAATWILGAAILLIRLGAALFRLRRLESESQPVTVGSVPILINARIKTPLTWGIRRSVILLPASLVSGDRAVCESALRHEQAHIARWDWAWNLLAELVCALCWFQPGAWWLRGSMRVESERACDDLVLLSGITGPDYAAHLVQILRTVCTTEVAPAMAQSRGMEERMRHILDAARPRRAQKTWLAASAALAVSLLSLATVRVTARTVSVKPPGGLDSTKQGSRRSVMSKGRDKSVDPPDKPAAGDGARLLPGASAPTLTVKNADQSQSVDTPTIGLKDVVWGKAVDGLQPGFLLNTPVLSNNPRVLLNSRIDYQVLVRNTTGRERMFKMRCCNWDGDLPYVIPGDAYRVALRSGTIPPRFRAMGVSDLAVMKAGYYVQLGPGEAIVVPRLRGLTLGDADKQSFPRMEAVNAGKNWIVQPITIHGLTAEETAQAVMMTKTPYSQKVSVVTIGRDGKVGRKAVPVIGAQSGGKQLLAAFPIEIGSAEPTNVSWGREQEGLRLGLRLPQGTASFPRLSQAKFEVLLSNRSDLPKVCSWLGYPTINQFSPNLYTADGQPIQFIRTLAGPYMNQETKLAPGETVVLGTISVPEDEAGNLDALPVGRKRAEFDLEVTLPDRKKVSLKSGIAFTVTHPETSLRVSGGPPEATSQTGRTTAVSDPPSPSSPGSEAADPAHGPGTSDLPVAP